MNIYFNYEDGKTNCIIEDKGIIGIGNALCHPDDKDVCSERTGSHIAEQRAKIHFLQNKKEVKLKPALQALNHLYSTMEQSKYFNQFSYEAKRIRKEIENLNREIYNINCNISNLKQSLY